MTKPAKKQSLGRGISAIFGNSPEATISSINDKNADKIVGNIIELELDLIETNPFQPRININLFRGSAVFVPLNWQDLKLYLPTLE